MLDSAKHMYRDAGPALRTLAQFVLAPVLWSFWLVVFGLPHPMSPWLREESLWGLALLFLGAECITYAIAALAAHRAGQPRLALWAPMLQLYFPLATIAVWRAGWQLLRRPFHWDKTHHGVFDPADPPGSAPPKAAPTPPLPAVVGESENP